MGRRPDGMQRILRRARLDRAEPAGRRPERAEQARGHEQQHRGNEQQRYDELDLRTRARGPLLDHTPAGAPGVAGPRGERVGERGAVSCRPRERRGEGLGLAHRELTAMALERLGQRDADRHLSGDRMPEARERAARAPPDLGKRLRDRGAGLDRHPEEVEQRGQVTPRSLDPVAPAPREPGIRSEERTERRGDGHEHAQPAREERPRRRAGGRAGERGGELRSEQIAGAQPGGPTGLEQPPVELGQTRPPPRMQEPPGARQQGERTTWAAQREPGQPEPERADRGSRCGERESLGDQAATLPSRRMSATAIACRTRAHATSQVVSGDPARPARKPGAASSASSAPPSGSSTTSTPVKRA